MRLRLTAIAIILLPSSWALALTTSTVTFQNGVNSYTGTYDHYIAQTPDAGVDGSTQTDVILIGGSSTSTTAQQALIRFDNIFGNNAGQIPLGAKIIDASLQLSTIGGISTSTDGSDGPFTVAGLTSPFNSTTTFSTYTGGRGAWFEDGHTTRPQGTFGRLDVGETQATDIRSIVQQWSDQTLTNNGVAVTGGFPSGTDTWRILATGNTSASSHPKLSVTYTTDNLQTSTFQRGTNGYNSVVSARVNSKCNTTGTSCTGGSATETTADGNTLVNATLQTATGNSSEILALFKFSDVFGSNAGQAPATKPVAKAFLVMTTLDSSSTNARTNDPMDAYAMLRPWTTSTLFSGFGSTIGLQSTDGDIAYETLGRTKAAANDSEIWFDVTNYMERVRTGTPDNGIVVQPRGSEGWIVAMNNASTVATRPRLVVLSDLSAAGNPFGDFDNSGTVDAGDYVVWRKNETANSALPNDNGAADQSTRYSLFRSNFGSSGSVPAPQPTTLLRYDPSTKGGSGTATTTWSTLPAVPGSGGMTRLDLVRGGGVVATGLANGFSSNNWTLSTNDPNNPNDPTDRNNAIANNDFIEWGFTLDGSHTASLSALDLFLRRSSAAAAKNFEVQASLDNFATAPVVLSDFTYMGRIDGDAPVPDPSLDTPFFYMTNDQAGRPDTGFSPSDPIPQIVLSTFSQLQNIAAGSTVKFRLYAWGATSDTSTIAFRVNGPKVTGILSAISGVGAGAAVPEPSTALLAGICATLFAVGRRRRLYL